jgi:geranylgeranyl pyrophosphate synthase
LATASASDHLGDDPITPLNDGQQNTQPGSPKHLKVIPDARATRERIRDRCSQVAERMDKSCPLDTKQMESTARAILTDLQMPEAYLGWTMVMLASSFWRDQVAAVPPQRRLCLLPHCLRHQEGCQAEVDEQGLACAACGRCIIADFQLTAEAMGYRVLVAEGSPVVLKIIVSGEIDAIVGVACLNVLEKALDKILLAGIPCMAVPLLSSDCQNSLVDGDWVDEMIRVEHREPVQTTRSYIHLLRAASNLFETDALQRIAPRQRGVARLAEGNGQPLEHMDPIAATEAIAYDFLAKGGKYYRPFITLAVYDALTGAHGTQKDGGRHIAKMSDAVRRTAVSIEAFHKASLIHDDIEDDDAYRYGQQALHCVYGTPTAINIGDYLIGLGYRLISGQSTQLSANVVADVVGRFAEAHTRLSEGQGAELLWRDAMNKRLAPLDALKIYALKTAPAFEAALLAGARLAGPTDAYEKPLRQFARNLGVAFQILNDLKDWTTDRDNKMSSGGDILGGRPTVLWALALDSLERSQQTKLMELASRKDQPDRWRLTQVRQLYQQAKVFDKAYRLVEKHRQRAESVADELEPDALRRLLHYLIDTVLERPPQNHAPEWNVVPDWSINVRNSQDGLRPQPNRESAEN